MNILDITSTTWLMTGMGIGVVFGILVLLILVLQVFNFVAEKTMRGAQVVQKQVKNTAATVLPINAATEADKAAIAVALHLYMGGVHDDESGVITIHQDEHPAWHAELNPEL